MLMDKKPKVFVGVSGGVDSSVALALLKNEGYDVTGVFLKVWAPDFLPCDWREERRSAMRVCATLDVPFITIDCEAEYKKEVVDYMIREYSEGRVPNPDVFCNKYVKFGVFLKKALEMGVDYVATGHYAQVKENLLNRDSSGDSRSRAGESERAESLRGDACSARDTVNKNFQLYESVDKEKDQSYFVYTLGQHELSHALFPIGHMTKPEVRKLAHKFGLPTATKKDSQGLCFIGKIDMKEFLTHYIETKEGEVLNTKGKVIGFHDGAIFLTIGQRHGFTVTKKTGDDPRYFVVSKDLEKNTVTVGSKESDGDKINSIKEIVLKDLHLISDDEKDIENKISVRIRYRQQKQICEVKKENDGYHVVFDEPQSGIAVGQSAVFYDGEVCVGGGIIEKVF